MKKIFVYLIPVIIFGVSCKPVVKEETAIKYSDVIKPLEYENLKFKSYQLIQSEKINSDLVYRKIKEVFTLLKKKDQRFISDTARDRESKYIGFRNADDPSGVFEMNRVTGRIIYNAGLKEYGGDVSTEGLPDNEEAVMLAKQYFRQLKLEIDEKELSEPIVSGLEMSVKPEQGDPKIYKKMVTIRYNRVLDGLPVEGATRMVMSFGKKAELTSMIADWGRWESKDLGQEEIIKPDEIIKQIEKRILEESAGAKEILVDQRYVTLYDDGQGTMEPAVYTRAMLKYMKKGQEGKEQEFSVPMDFYQPLMTGSAAVFPHVKDMQLKLQPKGDIKPVNDAVLKKNDE